MSCNGNYINGWGKDTPNTFETAKPNEMIEVKDAHVIHITNGYYRGATFSGTFEIAKPRNPFWETKKGRRVFVKAYWFCHKPRTSFPAILIQSAEYKVENHYNGKVVRNIGT
jgi:hypothetical protein